MSSEVTVSGALEVDHLTSAHSYVLEWRNATGAMSALTFCSFRNLCISGRQEGSNRIEWFLNADAVSAQDEAAFATIFKRCFHTMYKKDDHFAIRKQPSANYIPGNTLAFFKDEGGNHPASWARVWAPVTSMLVKGSSILQEIGISSIDRVQVRASTPSRDWPNSKNLHKSLVVRADSETEWLGVLHHEHGTKERPRLRF